MSYIRATEAARDSEKKIVEKWRENSRIKWNKRIKNKICIGNAQATYEDLQYIVEKNWIKYYES